MRAERKAISCWWNAAIAGLAATELVSACAVPAITVEMSLLASLVIFSAMTTATAFGSLWFSSHPGTSSVGALPRHDACRRGSISADPHGAAAAGSLDLIVAETLTVQATFWRSRRKWKNSMPSRRRRLIISGDMIISPTIEAIFDGRK